MISQKGHERDKEKITVRKKKGDRSIPYVFWRLARHKDYIGFGGTGRGGKEKSRIKIPKKIRTKIPVVLKVWT